MIGDHLGTNQWPGNWFRANLNMSLSLVGRLKVSEGGLELVSELCIFNFFKLISFRNGLAFKKRT